MDSMELKELLRVTTAFSILSDEELDHLAATIGDSNFTDRAGSR